MNKHDTPERIERDHITLSLGVSNYWLSMVQEQGEYHDCFELALVRYIPPRSLLHDRQIVCVPLTEWFDKYADESEMSIDLRDYRLSNDETQSSLVADAITKALAYINKENK